MYLANSMQIKAVRENTVVATNILTRQERTIEEVDSVVLALGGVANDSLYKALKGKVAELYVIGQAGPAQDARLHPGRTSRRKDGVGRVPQPGLWDQLRWSTVFAMKS